MTLQDILREAETLSTEERRELIKSLVDTLTASETPKSTKRRSRHLTELRGLGKEIWQEIDTQEYVNQMRDEWDQPR